LAGFQVTTIGRFWVTTEDGTLTLAIRTGLPDADVEVLDRDVDSRRPTIWT